MSVAVLHNSTHPALSPVQAQVINALAAGSTISAAALAAGIHRSTIYNWINDLPAFSTELDKARHEYADSLRDQLKELSASALSTLRSLLDNPNTPPSVRLRAALAVLERPRFPNQGWTLPEPVDTPNQQLLQAEMASLEADYRHLCLRENIERAAVRAGAEPVEAFARNAPCPCGSGKKYKRCCGPTAPPQIHPPPVAPR